MGSERSVVISIPSSPESLPIVRSAVERMACAEGFPESDSHGITWAIDEALANVIKHGYEGRKDQLINIRLQPVDDKGARRGLIVTVRDYGRQVDPEQIRGRDLDDVRPGGLGVHVIRSVMDEVQYSCVPGGGMQLVMVKYMKSDKAAEPSADE